MIPVMADLQGPVIRILTKDAVDIRKGKRYRVGYSSGGMWIPNEAFFKGVDRGDILIVDDGRLLFKVDETHKDHIYMKALIDGTLYSNKKVLIKGKEIVDTPLTEKDIRDLEFSLKHNIEYIALSMVRTGDDIKILKEKIEEFGGDPWILAKIENPSGVENISEIAGEADGVIVARGDLGQYYPLERIPSLQQSITYEGNRRGKITVIATQILESMRRNERPTRAEVTDVFKSVEEKVDAIMLTGETAIGRYPVEAVEWASKILEEADTRFNEETIFYNRDFEETLFDKFARGAIYMSHLLEGKIIGYTKRGNTARRLARYRPKSMVYMVTQNEVVASKISLLYGVKAIYEEAGEDYHDILERALSKLRKEGVIKEGDIVIFTVGVRPESTDMLRIEVA